MYIGTGNPVPFPGAEGLPWGKSRPGPDLYTDSLVKLDAKTGKLDWYYQATPHDLYDWDFQDPPILAKVGGRELAIGSGKGGIVAAVDAKTGKLAWRVPVGKHNGHDDDGLLAMRGEYSKLPKKATTIYPGILGGVIAPMAASKTTLFVPIVNHPATVEGGVSIGEGEEFTGEMVALDLATGKNEWSKKFETPAFGAPVAVNDMVFFATFDGTVHGLDGATGERSLDGAAARRIELGDDGQRRHPAGPGGHRRSPKARSRPWSPTGSVGERGGSARLERAFEQPAEQVREAVDPLAGRAGEEGQGGEAAERRARDHVAGEVDTDRHPADGEHRARRSGRPCPSGGRAARSPSPPRRRRSRGRWGSRGQRRGRRRDGRRAGRRRRAAPGRRFPRSPCRCRARGPR